MDMDAIINDLPSIVVRLKTLERVHQSALSVDSRLEMLEGIVNDLSSEVSSNNEVILSLQEVRVVKIWGVLMFGFFEL